MRIFTPVPARAAHRRAFCQRPPPRAPSVAPPLCARSGRPLPTRPRCSGVGSRCVTTVSAPRASPRCRQPARCPGAAAP